MIEPIGRNSPHINKVKGSERFMSRYLFDESAVEGDILCLLSILNASEQNHHLLAEYSEIGIFHIEWMLVQELLIRTAIKLRLIDDLFNRAGKPIDYSISSVGYLTSDTDETNETNETKSDLCFREACNKIIHASDFDPQLKVARIINNHEDKVYLPFIKLKGQKNRSVWIAHIDISKYCICALTLLRRYDMSEVYTRTGEL